jgi:hypothetical protein
MNYFVFGIALATVIPQRRACPVQSHRQKKAGTVLITNVTSRTWAATWLPELTGNHPIGCNQPPIAPAEIIGAVQRFASDIPDKKRATFSEITKSGALKHGDLLTTSTELWSNDSRFQVWCPDRVIGGYRRHIREQTISWRPHADMEKAMLGALRKKLEKAMEGQKTRGFRTVM